VRGGGHGGVHRKRDARHLLDQGLGPMAPPLPVPTWRHAASQHHPSVTLFNCPRGGCPRTTPPLPRRRFLVHPQTWLPTATRTLLRHHVHKTQRCTARSPLPWSACTTPGGQRLLVNLSPSPVPPTHKQRQQQMVAGAELSPGQRQLVSPQVVVVQWKRTLVRAPPCNPPAWTVACAPTQAMGTATKPVVTAQAVPTLPAAPQVTVEAGT
jgi:hypothetical protein